MFQFKSKNESAISTHDLKPAPSYKDCLAKTYKSADGKVYPGRTVLNHCQIVGEVARSLMARMPNFIREKLFPNGAELVAAAHDVGKISPTFQKKICTAIDSTESIIPGLERINPELEKSWGGHGGVSQATTKSLEVGKFIPEIVGQHHGYSPNLAGRIATDEIFGGNSWEVERQLCLVDLKTRLNKDWPLIENTAQAKVVSGLTTVADWIGSGSFFEDPLNPWETHIKEALDNAGFVKPRLNRDLSFSDVFGFSARQAQQSLIEHATTPGVYILEAPMGLGKTEAALYVAYLAIERNSATGIYFALPTQLTSDKIHERMNVFLEKILSKECPHRNAMLLHGNAWLKQDFGVDGAPGGSWFNSGKRGILAPFAVGTVDQALMAVMNVKHGFVRAFGLAGKVVILDEVHTYDAYTGTILDTLVNELKALQCTVIILSATLTQQRRSTLLGINAVSRSYPLLTALSNENALCEIPIEANRIIKVKIQVVNHDIAAIDEVLLRAEQGQHILWVENTVAEAQDIYKLLSSRAVELDIECGLLHSRFLKIDRTHNEANWVKLYGKDEPLLRKQKGRILIGTQVVEQSLDIDADFLVTRMCPTDMLLQRLGRLWRHDNTLRPIRTVCEAWILAPQLQFAISNAKQAFGSSAYVYCPYVLCRSLEVWLNQKSVNLPDQIRLLIEETYSERLEVGELQNYKNELLNKRDELKQLALVGLSQGGKTLPESKATTRYSEQDTIDVLLVRSYFKKADKSAGYLITLLSGETIDLPSNPKSLKRQDWRKKSALLTQNTVKVTSYLAPDAVTMSRLSGLKDYLYLGDKDYDEPLLRIAKVLDSDELVSIDGGPVGTSYKLYYDSRLGYQATKNNI